MKNEIHQWSNANINLQPEHIPDWQHKIQNQKKRLSFSNFHPQAKKISFWIQPDLDGKGTISISQSHIVDSDKKKERRGFLRFPKRTSLKKNDHQIENIKRKIETLHKTLSHFNLTPPTHKFVNPNFCCENKIVFTTSSSPRKTKSRSENNNKKSSAKHHLGAGAYNRGTAK